MKEIEIAGRVGKNRKQKDGLPFEGRSSFLVFTSYRLL